MFRRFSLITLLVIIFFSCKKDISTPGINSAKNHTNLVAAETTETTCATPFRIVILGSSSAAGQGATPIDSSWANKFTAYMKSFSQSNIVINLAASTYTTYQVLNPNGFIPPPNRPYPNTAHNITAALSYNPHAIIINLPTNDVVLGYSSEESKANYERAIALCVARNIPVWVSTSQPRNILANLRDTLKMMRDWTYTRFGDYAVDFWTTIANPNGTINSIYNYDGSHLNNKGHEILFERISGKGIVDTLCATVPPIVPVNLPARIEAENWIAQTGVKTEVTKDPLGGHLDVGWIDSTDWMDYYVNVPTTGNYTFNYRIATNKNNAKFNILSDGALVASAIVPNTFSYQAWKTVSITIPLTEGTQTLRLVSKRADGWNINWLEFVAQ